jgi:predicted DNA binding protein
VIEATLSLKGLKCWAADISARHSIPITVLDSRPGARPGETLNWIRALVDLKEADGLISGIRGHHSVVSSELVKTKRGVMGVVKCNRCPLQSASGGLPCTVREHSVAPDRSAELTILASRKDSLGKIMSRLETAGLETTVLRTARQRERVLLTPKQERVLRTALANGYFDYPRKLRQRELSMICGMASSSLAELMRRAERNAIRELLARRD